MTYFFLYGKLIDVITHWVVFGRPRQCSAILTSRLVNCPYLHERTRQYPAKLTSHLDNNPYNNPFALKGMILMRNIMQTLSIYTIFCIALPQLSSQMRWNMTVCSEGLQLRARDDACDTPSPNCPQENDCEPGKFELQESIRSDEGLTLETSAFESLYGG